MRADETSLLAVLGAGDGCWGPDPDFDLIGACARIEAEVREAEWAALERFLAHVEGTPPDDHLIAPSDPEARLELARAMVRIGWCRAGATA